MYVKSCPFCGKSDSLVLFDDNYQGYFQVLCDSLLGGCGASSGMAKTKEEAVEGWNRRANHELD